MKIKILDKTFDSGKIVRKKYKIYTEAKEKLNNKNGVEYTDEDLDLMVNTLVSIYDNQFTEEDINDNFEIADIIFEFMHCDIEVMGKLDSKIDKATKVFTKNKK
ncbi:hypothetical protein M4I33_13080 [Clostridium sp. LY3-2]|uniref:phage tail assembly chaperone G n=1 Tax=Clostridium sp. LY3-2 TaxID=2942482 RepID=UPI0021526488|nr:hypothetical protein [Clostridium sp. LY3-2]MCR6515803.1 hypothetical protein [Clostridium sp. LY3-2]